MNHNGISSKVWWYKQNWTYFFNPRNSKSNYELVPIKQTKYKSMYLPFYYNEIKINFYSEFLIKKYPTPLF
jgi:hypothetical protein